MQHLVEAVRAATASGNWYAALALALTLPDACARASGAGNGKQRYIDWCTKYVTPMYLRSAGVSGLLPMLEEAGISVPPQFQLTFQHGSPALTGQDVYLLRCAFLHSGEFELEGKGSIQRFEFAQPANPNHFLHLNLNAGQSMQLQVDQFCADMCTAVERWLHDVDQDEEVQVRLGQLAMINIV